MNLYTEHYRINPIPFDPADNRIQFRCSFFSHWLPGFVGKSAGGVHAIYSLVLRGKYHVQYPECRYTIPENHFTINRIPRPYLRAATAGHSPVIRKSFMIHRNAFHDMIVSRLFPAEHTLIPLSDSRKIETIMDAVHAQLEHPDTIDEGTLAGLFFRLMHELHVSGKANHLPDILNHALAFITRNLSDPALSRERIASECAVSVRTLSRIFRDGLDTQPGEYIIHARLERVRDMLALPGLSIKEIAELSGFRSAGFLARQFRERYAVTPREYRDQSRFLH